MGRVGNGRASEEAPSPLTPRETEILRMIAEGHGNAEIATSLYIGLGTVKGHIRDILEKLAAADRTQAAVVALRRGFI
jgi:DNA-binding NarL/FixJ family response regulator